MRRIEELIEKSNTVYGLGGELNIPHTIVRGWKSGTLDASDEICDLIEKWRDLAKLRSQARRSHMTPLPGFKVIPEPEYIPEENEVEEARQAVRTLAYAQLFKQPENFRVERDLFYHTEFVDKDFSKFDLYDVTFEGCKFTRCKFNRSVRTGSEFRMIRFRECEIESSEISCEFIKDVDFDECKISACIFR